MFRCKLSNIRSGFSIELNANLIAQFRFKIRNRAKQRRRIAKSAVYAPGIPDNQRTGAVASNTNPCKILLGIAVEHDFHALVVKVA